jgi:hypothetical protein
MSVHVSTPFLNDEWAWIQRLEWLRNKKLFAMGQFGFRQLPYTVVYAASNDRGRGRPFVGFLTSPRARIQQFRRKSP